MAEKKASKKKAKGKAKDDDQVVTEDDLVTEPDPETIEIDEPEITLQDGPPDLPVGKTRPKNCEVCTHDLDPDGDGICPNCGTRNW